MRVAGIRRRSISAIREWEWVDPSMLLRAPRRPTYELENRGLNSKMFWHMWGALGFALSASYVGNFCGKYVGATY